MAHIIIAGRPNSEDTSECILLAENLHAKFPSIRYIKVVRHSEEWENYSERVCNLFGFLKNTHPLIFYSNGCFIGNKDDFFKLIKTNFQIGILSKEGKLNVEPSVIKHLTQEHIKITNDEYFTRIRGSKIRNIIDKKLEEISREDINTISNITRYNSLDSNYQIQFLGDLEVYSKYSEKFQPMEGEYIQYPDPLEKGAVEVEVNYNINKLNSNHSIEDVKNENDELEDENRIENDDDHEEEGRNIEINSARKNNQITKKKDVHFTYYKTFDTPIYKILNKEKYIIESEYGLHYKLILNPFFTFYGETLLYHHQGLNKESDDCLVINDFGRLPSLRKITYDENLLTMIKSQVNIGEYDKVSSLESNVYDTNFISEQDLQYLVKAVQEINGMATLRVLPYKFNDFKQFGSSKIKILNLPMKDLNYEEVPLTKKVEQMIRFIKREKVKQFFDNVKEENHCIKKTDLLIDNEEFLHFFELKDSFYIESYQNLGIKHMIKSYNWQELNVLNIKKDINHFFKDLNINQESGFGFILLLTKSYLFIAPLTNPFFNNKDHVPIFADPTFFAGIFNLPLIQAEWPETIKSENVQFNLEDILKKSTNI